MNGLPRSSSEMQFAASLVPCPTCGAPTPRLDLYGNGNAWIMSALCPSCKTPRRFDFTTNGSPMKLPPPARLELGGAEPSQIITAAQFSAELDRLVPSLRDDPATIPLAEWTERSNLANRALTCVLELRKFPAAQQPAHLAGWYQRILALTDRFTADAPRTWLVRGNGKLHPSEEIRALLNQASSVRPLTAADLDRWLSVRRDLAKDSAASAIRAWDDGAGTHAELTYTRGSLDDIADAFGIGHTFGKVPKSPATAEVTVSGHRVRAEIEHADKRVSKVTLHFTPVN